MDGNAVSFIHSLSAAFGSGVVAGDTGITLNNRAGRGFTLDEGHPNVIAPGKRTMHTLNAYLVCQGGQPWLVGGTPGGDQQTQWSTQVITSMIDHGLSPQEAVEVPRWFSFPGTDPANLGLPAVVRVEERVPEATRRELAARGHVVETLGAWAGGGAVQLIQVDPARGVLRGGSDPRPGGVALGLFKLSQDPHFVEKLRDVVGLYLNPPDKALVLCGGREEPDSGAGPDGPAVALAPGDPGASDARLQAAWNNDVVCGAEHPRWPGDRRVPAAPSEPGVHPLLPHGGSRDARGDRPAPDRRQFQYPQEPAGQRWLKRHPRFHLHFIPTSSSWLNLVERWFGEITQKRIRRGTFRSVKELVVAITEYLREYNQAPTRFVWTKDADMILGKIRRCKEALGTSH